MNGRVVLEARNLSKSYGPVQALSSVSIAVHAGEVVALVGDNGAGKSTLVKNLTGVVLPDSGEILVDGSPVAFGAPRDASTHGIAAVYQDLALCPNLNIADNMFLGRELIRGRGLARVLGRVDKVSMQKRALETLQSLRARIPAMGNAVEKLSGGQRQSVAIARAVLSDPHVIILDEPTAALGVAQTEEVLNLITSLRDRGLGVILISHNMSDVMRVADTIVVLRHGANHGTFVAAETTPEEVVAAITGATAAVGS